jgi:proteasome lid subunit RPN8/RPN11
MPLPIKKFFRTLKRWIGRPSHEVEMILVKQSVIDDIREMAKGAHPRELFCFLASSNGVNNKVLIINEIHIQAYDSSHDSASVMTSNLPMTTSIIGTAHSHPGGTPTPSEQDLHFYSKLGFVHMIIAEPYNRDNIRFYDKKGKRISIKIV